MSGRPAARSHGARQPLTGQAEEAIVTLTEAMAVFAAAPWRGPADVANMQANLAAAFERAARFGEAEVALLEALAVYQREPSRKTVLPQPRTRIADSHQRRGRPEDAARYRD
jgi:hypothetical protein